MKRIEAEHAAYKALSDYTAGKITASACVAIMGNIWGKHHGRDSRTKGSGNKKRQARKSASRNGTGSAATK